MEELLRTNDLVLISAIQSILGQVGIEPFVADSFAASVEGSLGMLPRRLLVLREEVEPARQALREAGLGAELALGPEPRRP
jgi:hypothetical protein